MQPKTFVYPEELLEILEIRDNQPKCSKCKIYDAVQRNEKGLCMKCDRAKMEPFLKKEKSEKKVS